jgi:NAD(P)-dependent dehydrogenase (short-subunit alcohol dehydrogenase family)
MKRYDGAVTVVTGASAGIGKRVAGDLAARGATVIGLARRADLLSGLEQSLKAVSPESRTQTCDVCDADAYRDALRGIWDERGRVDILVNNAGIEESNPIADTPDVLDTFRRLFETNFFGLVAGTLTVLPRMLERRSGIVVNVSSDAARAPEPGHGAYSASKAAVSAFTESVAHEAAARGVRVHVLYPAWVPTAMGMSGIGEDDPLPPKPVRRTDAQVSQLLLERMGGPRMEINAAWLPLLAPIGRTLMPRAYQREMQRRFATSR